MLQQNKMLSCRAFDLQEDNLIMLILSRKIGESLVIGENPSITATVISIQGTQVKIGIAAPKNVPVDREEIRRMKKELARKNAAVRLLEEELA